MRFLLLLLFFFLICCEFSDENLQGPPEVTEDEKKSDDDDEETITKEYIASINQDPDGGTAIRIEPAQDFSNEKDDVKGMYFFYILLVFLINCEACITTIHF